MQSKQIIPIFAGEFPKQIIPLINSAKKSLHIIVFDWRWYPSDPGCSCQLFNQSIVNASRRCVSVSCLVNDDSLLSLFSTFKIKCRKLISRHLLHTKLMIIDEKHLIIGSHNYTQNAFTSNFESSVALLDCDDLSDYLKYFNSLFSSR